MHFFSRLEYLLEENFCWRYIYIYVFCDLCVSFKRKLFSCPTHMLFCCVCWSWSFWSSWNVGDLGWVLLNSCGGVLAQRAYQRGDLPFFAKFLGDRINITRGMYGSNQRRYIQLPSDSCFMCFLIGLLWGAVSFCECIASFVGVDHGAWNVWRGRKSTLLRLLI